ncbi:MAG: alpha-amylase family glycosyl hydrolase, partial [bacterium]
MGALFTLSLLVFSSLFTSVPNNTEIKDEIIYSLMIDRFYDGDLKNNVPEYAYQGNTIYDKWNRDMLVKMYDKDKETWNKYWGGDLKGLYEKLDYLKELGITTVMITPIFQNANGYLTVEGTETRVTSYHGYWLKDFYR